MAPKGADKEPCSTAILRSLNVFLAAGFFVVLQQLYRRLHPGVAVRLHNDGGSAAKRCCLHRLRACVPDMALPASPAVAWMALRVLNLARTLSSTHYG